MLYGIYYMFTIIMFLTLVVYAIQKLFKTLNVRALVMSFPN